jgi:hypothetical protein
MFDSLGRPNVSALPVVSRAGRLMAFDQSGNPTTLPVVVPGPGLAPGAYISAKDFGAKGDGVTDDTLAIQAAVDYAAVSGRALLLDGVFLVSGVSIPSGLTAIGAHQSDGLTGTGTVGGLVGGLHSIRLQNLSLYGSLKLEIGGISANRAHNIYVSDIYVETSGTDGIRLIYIDGLTATRLRVRMTDPTEKNNLGVMFGNVGYATVDDIRVSGYVSGGIACAGTATTAQPSLYRSQLSNLYVEKETGYVPAIGAHGIYLLGAQETVFNGLFVNGDWTNSAEYSLKFRDSHDCLLSYVRAKTVRVSADNNTIHVQHTLRNRFSDVLCENFVIFKDVDGSISDLTLEDVRCTASFSSNAVDGPVWITGNFYTAQAIDVNAQGCIFSRATVDIPKMDGSGARFANATLVAKNSHFLQDVRVHNQAYSIHNSTIDGNLIHTSGSTDAEFTLVASNVSVGGEMRVNSGGNRVITAIFKNVSIAGDEVSGIAANPNVKKYAGVAFGDRYYQIGDQYLVAPPLSASALAIGSIGNAINISGKYAGRMVWDTTNNRMMRASGPAAADPWYVVDGSASITPA